MRRPVLLLAALLLSLLAGCGGDDHADHEADGEPKQSTTASSGTDTTEDTQPGGQTSTSGEHDHESATFPAADATDTAKISMRDFVFVDMPATVTGPKLRVEAKNNGPAAHEVVIFDADGNEVGGTDPVVSGESAELSIELPAGTYEMRCQIPISNSETHYDRGMKAVFQVV